MLFESCQSFLPEIVQPSTVLGSSPFVLQPMSERYGLKQVCGMIGSPLEGSLDTSRLIQTLHQALQMHNIELRALHRD